MCCKRTQKQQAPTVGMCVCGEAAVYVAWRPPHASHLPPNFPPCFCSAEQAEFLRRKAQETRSYSAPVEVRC